jgi:REP element-mobilizing transposase RayT
MSDVANLPPSDQEEATLRSRGYLPHWERTQATYFVTIRLDDALPQHVLQAYETERAALLAKARTAGTLTAAEQERLDRLVSRRIQGYLDAGAGACHLTKPEVAQIVAQALRFFNSSRYHLFAWCIMPNHVHVVMQPVAPATLSTILHSWKSFTTRQVQKQVGISGVLWQREYYDHRIRSEEALWRIVNYVAENPLKANLQNWPWVEILIPREDASSIAPSV